LTHSKNFNLYSTYYTEVGKYKLLTAEEEASLLHAYNTCSHCKKPIPHEVKRTVCPSCFTLIDDIDNKTMLICSHCNTRYSKYVPTKICPHCATPRNLAARDKLIVSNLRFVIKKAKQLTSDAHRLQSLISAGNEGLLHAVDKYKENVHTRFLTYADWWIRKKMYDAINSSTVVRIPPHKRRKILKQLKETKYVCIHCGLQVNDPTVNTTTPCTKNTHFFEVDTTTRSDQLGVGIPLTDNILDDTYPDLKLDTDEKMFGNNGLKVLLLNALNHPKVSARGRFIICNYYGLTSKERVSEPKNLHQLAEILGVTPERIRQLKEKTLHSIKRYLQRSIPSIPKHNSIP